MNLPVPFLALSLFGTSILLADGPADNRPENVRSVPRPGLVISDRDRSDLNSMVRELGREIDSTENSLDSQPALLNLIPDVRIFHNAVRYALAFDEFYKTNQIAMAKRLLRQGMERVGQLRSGIAPWTTSTGLVVRGYVSKIDGSVQPYGLVVPASFRPNEAHKFRLDAWFHGRGETLTELDFINGRQGSPGQFVPDNAFVLHLYGRYCNANKFAGEIDLFEALENVRQQYPIDENRLIVRGFSMGGAACWQFAVHYAGLWAAAAPGAGFSETPEFLRVFQKETLKPTWYERKLWHWYDCTDYAINLFNCPTVAYSGEIDSQKQAADIMAEALAKEGIELTHLIGPQTSHRYHPETKTELNRRIDSIAAQGRNPVPKKIRFTTWTLRYNTMRWVTIDALEEHWERARVDADIVDDHTIRVVTRNVTEMTLAMPAGLCPLDVSVRPIVVMDGQPISAAQVSSDRSWTARFRKVRDSWQAVDGDLRDGGLRKRHGLQGPIDDAFMDSFLMVTPTGHAMNEDVGAWTASEQEHAVRHWRSQFRGEARVKKDIEITDDDIARHNLVLWGDPQSNVLLSMIADRLPIRWDAHGVHTADAIYPPGRYVPVLIYPNPLNPNRYVVLNSGFTFREYDYLNNARQVAKLPDWAVIDLSVPVSSQAPGGIANAGFFDERWQLSDR